MDPKAERAHFVQVLRSFEDAQLVTRTPAGMLRSRPMAIAAVEDDGTAWFVTSHDTGKVFEIEEQAQVAVTFHSRARFASLSGRASIVDDRARIRALWTEKWRPWVPGGPDTRDLVLIRVEPIVGEYWDQAGAKGLRHLWDVAKAAIAGERADAVGEDGHVHGKVDLS